MRFIITIIALFTSVASFAQIDKALTNRSINVEERRSYFVPRSGFGDAAYVAGAARYAVDIENWQEQGLTFSTSFEPPYSWRGRQVFISVAASSHPYTVVVGGREVGSNSVAAMPAEFNVTRYIERDTLTPISIVMEQDIASAQLESWGSEELHLGAVTMLSQPTMYIRDVEVATTRSAKGVNASLAIIVKSEALNLRASRINYELLNPMGRSVLKGSLDVRLEMRGEDILHLYTSIPDSLAWSVDNPNQYKLNLSTQYRGRNLEYISLDLGLRSLEVDDEGALVINCEKQEIKAVEVTSDIVVDDLVKFKAKGYNTAKIAAGQHSEQLLSAADSIGLYVIATAPINSSKSGSDILRGGNPTNDPEYLGQYLERVDALYNVVKLHPSVIALSLADSSLNGINLYESYLRLKARENQRPVIYTDGGGEWNSDKLLFELK